ncbi:MAG TPA: hypothetical protein VFX05_09100 [Casimicrobiaceae bacterium]|nr:hypothetical protein [Casimicrobiaceae bacterium]
MEAQPYLVVRDNDLARLEAAVNERIDDGYSIAGPLFAVTPAQGGVLYVQPMVIEFDDTGVEEDMDADDEPAPGRQHGMAHGSAT